MKKIKRWYYKDSDMVKRNLGYGDNLPSHETPSIEVQSQDVNIIFLFADKFVDFIKRTPKIMIDAICIWIGLIFMYGFITVGRKNYREVIVGFIVKYYIAGLIFCFIVCTAIGIYQRWLGEKVSVKPVYTASANIMLIMILCNFLWGNTEFSLSISYSVMALSILVQLCINFIYFVVKSVLDYLYYRKGLFIYSKY